MLKRMLKGITLGASVFGVAAGALAVYTNSVEERSLTSWAIEKVMWAQRMKEDGNTKAAGGVAAFAAEQEADTIPLPTEYIDGDIQEHFVASMQVLTWNDSGKSDQPVLFYIHGGAYVHHAISFNYKFIDRIAKATGAKVVMPIYPLGPKHTYDQVYRMMVAAYAETVRNAASPAKVSVLGDSAGGGFALALGQVLADEHLPQPKQYIVFSPWTDLRMTNDAVDQYESVDPMLSREYLRVAGLAWAGSTEATSDPRVSPILGDFTGMAPITVFMGTHEILFADIPPLEQAFKDGQVDYRIIIGEKMNHAYPFFPIPEAKAAIKQTVILISE